MRSSTSMAGRIWSATGRAMPAFMRRCRAGSRRMRHARCLLRRVSITTARSRHSRSRRKLPRAIPIRPACRCHPPSIDPPFRLFECHWPFAGARRSIMNTLSYSAHWDQRGERMTAAGTAVLRRRDRQCIRVPPAFCIARALLCPHDPETQSFNRIPGNDRWRSESRWLLLLRRQPRSLHCKIRWRI